MRHFPLTWVAPLLPGTILDAVALRNAVIAGSLRTGAGIYVPPDDRSRVRALLDRAGMSARIVAER